MRFPSKSAKLSTRRAPDSLDVWVVHAGEPIAGLDLGAPPHRYGMIVNALAAAGHNVTWWSSTYQHLTKRHRFDGPVSLSIGHGRSLRLLHTGPTYRKNVSPARVLHHRALAKAFRETVQHEQAPDVIVVSLPTPELAEAAVVYGQERGIPVIVDVQDPWPDVYLSVLPKRLHGLARTLLSHEYNRLTRTMEGASGITAVSDSFLSWAVSHRTRDWNVPQQVFPLGSLTNRATDLPGQPSRAHSVRMRHGVPEGAHLVVFSGSFGHSYDFDTVVKCADLLQREGNHAIHFALAGDGDRMQDIRRRSAHLSNMTLTGWLDPESLSDLLQTADVGLCAYRKRATQTLPYKCFEYMAAGLPQVSSLKGELANLLNAEGVGRAYEAGDPASLRSAVMSLVDGQKVRQQMGQRARLLFHQRFDAARIYPELVRFIEERATVAARRSARAIAAG